MFGPQSWHWERTSGPRSPRTNKIRLESTLLSKTILNIVILTGVTPVRLFYVVVLRSLTGLLLDPLFTLLGPLGTPGDRPRLTFGETPVWELSFNVWWDPCVGVVAGAS